MIYLPLPTWLFVTQEFTSNTLLRTTPNTSMSNIRTHNTGVVEAKIVSPAAPERHRPASGIDVQATESWCEKTTGGPAAQRLRLPTTSIAAIAIERQYFFLGNKPPRGRLRARCKVMARNSNRSKPPSSIAGTAPFESSEIVRRLQHLVFVMHWHALAEISSSEATLNARMARDVATPPILNVVSKSSFEGRCMGSTQTARAMPSLRLSEPPIRRPLASRSTTWAPPKSLRPPSSPSSCGSW